MRKTILLFCLALFAFHATGQTYQELSERAITLMDADSLARAEDLFRQALKLEPANPHNALLFSNIGMIQQREHKHTDAIESFTLALNMAPNAVPILLNRAASYMETGNTDRAYVDYCQALDFDKKNGEALLMRAYIYVGRRDYHAARMDYTKLLETEPYSYAAKLGMTILNQKEKKYQEAIDLLNTLFADEPHDAFLYVIRAGIENERGQVDLALVDLNEAIRIKPTHSDAYILRGEIYLSQKKKALARADFEKAISLGIPKSELNEHLRQCK